VLLDRFLDDAIEVDLDLVADGERAVVAGILRHIEEAGVHSGDSAAVLPALGLAASQLDEMREVAKRLALELGVVGLMNVQYAIHDGDLYVLEVNPRASRTVPFIAKAVGVPLVAVAVRAMAGQSLAEQGFTAEPAVPGVFVKAPVFPFRRFPGFDPVLGPEMRSTGEVMGVSAGGHFGNAFARAWLGAGEKLPMGGKVFVSVHDRDKAALVPVAKSLADLGFELLATEGTAAYLATQGLAVERVQKLHERRPHIGDLLINGQVAMVVNTPLGRASHEDDAEIRKLALKHGVPCVTTLSGARAAAEGIASLRDDGIGVTPLQELHRGG
jgi:carbamoyl-phosphate synthase large subunit